MSEPDVIDTLAGITPQSPLVAIRARRAAARDNAQASFDALFAPADPGAIALAERHAIALFVAGLHRDAEVTAFYRQRLSTHGPWDLVEAVDSEGARAAAEGPYGDYPEGPLNAENKAGPIHRVGPGTGAVLGRRLSAALKHAHLLVFRPRDASPDALQALLNAGWTTTEVVTISQIVAFLSFQIRVVHGLRVLNAAGAQSSTGYPATAVAAE